MRLEFAALDTNGDGTLDRREIDSWLLKMGVDDEHRKEIVDELFSKCDLNGDGEVSI